MSDNITHSTEIRGEQGRKMTDIGWLVFEEKREYLLARPGKSELCTHARMYTQTRNKQVQPGVY